MTHKRAKTSYNNWCFKNQVKSIQKMPFYPTYALTWSAENKGWIMYTKSCMCWFRTFHETQSLIGLFSLWLVALEIVLCSLFVVVVVSSTNPIIRNADNNDSHLRLRFIPGAPMSRGIRFEMKLSWNYHETIMSWEIANILCPLTLCTLIIDHCTLISRRPAGDMTTVHMSQYYFKL